MKNKKLPSCPYCGYKTKYLEAWLLKNKGEYHCPKCNRISDIRLDEGLYRKIVITMIIAIIITILSIIFDKVSIILKIVVLVLPFLVFYINIPHWIDFYQTEQPQKSNSNSGGLKKNTEKF